MIYKIVRNGAFVAALLLPLLGYAAPQTKDEYVERITARIGPVWPRAADALAIVMSIGIVSRYTEAFGHSDELPDKDWHIVLGRLIALSERTRTAVVRAVRSKESDIRKIFVAELHKLPQDDLTKITEFLESSTGSNWLAANSSFEQKLFPAVVQAGAYVVASRRRAQALLEVPAGSKPAYRAFGPPPILMAGVLEGGAGQAFFLMAYMNMLTVTDPSISELYVSAGKAIANESKRGSQVLSALTAAMGTAIPDGLKGFNPQQIFDKPDIETLERQITDLGFRARVAVDPMKTGNCHNRAIGADSYERGCYVEKNFEIAFKLWKESAEQGHVKSYCKVANWYRYGIGTKMDIRLAEKWEASYREQAFGRSCEPLKIDPRNPWLEIKQQ